ncbi:LysR substrate-binding domain-containing protein [Roseovarius aestuarii]|uniref:HTH-type transcriptional activator CmpR n=1 Tax=Roseovarius aestuarii TaxID=475083 RepID=A0A1X7BQX0_9RHOB|nr:LysR substrate-binding domain-containing protein [Roseovarius aestuarii]SMC11589.1 HTH-type transcriptional activator CmpR [Roseovarius aestuarii]
MLTTALRSFHAVAQHGGFSAAARALNISQPTLSTQVKGLETRYDVELFSRIGREVRLTPAGLELYQTTMQLHQSEAEAEDLLNSFKGLHSGSLRIAAVGPFHATDMIVAFKSRHPKIDISVQFGNSLRSFERLLSYEADVGLIAEVNADPRVITMPYSTHNVVVFVNAQHAFFDRDSISIHELESQKVIQREVGSTTRTAMEKALRDHQVSIDVVLDIGSREGIWKAVEQGLGIGFVADFEFVPHPNLRAIPITGADISTQYFLAFLADRKNSHLIRAFCDVARTDGV